MTARAHRILIPLAALLAILPLLLTGPSCGHDFDFHILSWLEASTQFAHLHYPMWAYTPAFNAGEPRFHFYPPFSWALGALLGLMIPWVLVPAAFTFISLTLSGFTAHALARRYASANAATLAAIVYLLNPYMLFTAYERTAYGELLAAAWLPLLFAAALAPRIRIAPLAIPIALLWLTNAPAAVMSCYALAILTGIRLILPEEFRHSDPELAEGEASPHLPPIPSPDNLGAPFTAPRPLAMRGETRGARPTRLHLALATIAATILGLTLSAFYLLPAAYERRDIQSDMATIQGMRIVDNTLFHHMSPVTADAVAHDVVLHTASLIAILILAAIVITAATLWVPHLRGAKVGKDPLDGYRSTTAPLLPLTLLTLLLALLLTPITLPVWTYTPELRFLQFPWRLTAILSTILLIFAARGFARLNVSPIWTYVASAALTGLLILPAWHFFHQDCDIEDTVPARVALYHSNLGTDPTDEYTPTTADNDALNRPDPPYWLTSNLNACDQPAPPNAKPGQAPQHLTLTPSTPQLLILDRRNFPLWHVTVNGTPAISCSRNDGLIAIPLPAGRDTIDLTQHPTHDQTAGLALSGLALLITITLTTKPGALRSPS
jgi:hypothetical protein